MKMKTRLPSDFVISSFTKMKEWYESNGEPYEILVSKDQYQQYCDLHPPRPDIGFSMSAASFHGSPMIVDGEE